MTEQQQHGDPYKEKFRADADPDLDKQVDAALAGMSLDQLMATDKPNEQANKEPGQQAPPGGANVRRGKVVSIGKDDVFVDFGGKELTLQSEFGRPTRSLMAAMQGAE